MAGALLLVLPCRRGAGGCGRRLQWTRAFYQSVGFLPARELPDLWPGNRALLLVMSLDDSNPTILS